MVFKRKVQQSLLKRALTFLWPETGFARGWRYMRHRVERINDTPGNIALGIACGALASFTPLFGLHFIVAALIAKLLRANIVSSLFGTMFGNPVTFPFIAAGSMSIGSALLGRIHSTATDGEGVISAFVEMGSLLWASILRAVGLGEPGTVSWTVARSSFHDFIDQVMLPYGLGGLILGIPTAIVIYYVTRPAIAAYQKRKLERLARRREEQARKRATAPEAAE